MVEFIPHKGTLQCVTTKFGLQTVRVMTTSK